MISLDKNIIRISNTQIGKDQFGYIKTAGGSNAVYKQINMKKCGHFCLSNHELNRCCICTKRQGWYTSCQLCEIRSEAERKEISAEIRKVMNAP